MRKPDIVFILKRIRSIAENGDINATLDEIDNYIKRLS